MKIRSLLVLLLLLGINYTYAQDLAYFGGKIPIHVEDRYNQCFDDLTAKWVPAFIDSLMVAGLEKDGEPYLLLAHSLQACRASVYNDSLSFENFSQQALVESKALNCDPLYYNTLLNQVDFYSTHKNAYKAQRLADRIIAEAIRSNKDVALYNGYVCLAVLQEANRNYAHSIDNYEKALDVIYSHKSDDNVNKAQMLYGIGKNYYAMGQYEKALGYMAQCKELYPSFSDAYLIEAISNFKLDRFDQFRQVVDEIKNLESDTIDENEEFIYMRALELALNGETRKALSLCDLLDNVEKRFFAISDVYKVKKDWSKALENYSNATVIRDSIRQTEYSDLLVSIQNEMNTSAMLREKDEQLRKSKSFTNYVTFGFILVFIILLAVYFYFSQRSKWQQRNLDDLNDFNRKLNEAKIKAEDESRMKTVFLQNMSHDLRTPLNAIVGFSQLLALPDGMNSDEDKANYNSYISSNSEMLMLLFEDILNIGEVERGNFKIENRPTLCNELCKKIMKCVEYRVPPGVAMKFTTNVEDNFRIDTDGRRIQQVLVNFLTNACKHTVTGEIRLDCQVNKEKKTVHFSVIDTGEGVSPEMRDKLFTRNVKEGGYDSHGFGLDICKTVAEKMNGCVGYDNSYTHGAKFDFIINLD